jgi:hypothetical protein
MDSPPEARPSWPRSDSISTPMMGPRGYFSSPFEKFTRDDTYQDWMGAFTLLGEDSRTV